MPTAEMATRAPFPENPEEFDHDDRIAYSKTAQTYVLEDENGEEWEWLSGPSKWSKMMDEALIKQQAEIYKVAGVDDDAPALDPIKKRKAAQDQPDSNKRAKSGANANSTAATSGTGAGAGPAKSKPARPSTAVFVTGLPDDVDSDEIRDVFKKYGIIAESTEDNEQRIKLYNDKDGNFKGEALIIYFRRESVRMAIDMLDGYEFPRDPGIPTTTITVSEADSTYKRHKDDTVAEERSGYKPKPSKAKAKKKAEEMNSRLADWSDDEPSTMKQTSSRFGKLVVLKRVFTQKELREDDGLLSDINEDMKEASAPYGTVKNITIFDQEEDGVVTIRFTNVDAASEFCQATHGRRYQGRPLEASIATGEEKFKKTRKGDKDKEEEEARRLEEYSKYIEGKDGEAEDGAAKPMQNPEEGQG